MRPDVDSLRESVLADLPWHTDRSVAGVLRIAAGALVLEGTDGRRVAIPLSAIDRVTVETTFGVLPALHVWHLHAGAAVRSRFEFVGEMEPDDRDAEIDIAGHVNPGLARDAAARLEGGLRALSGGLRGGRRVVRQAVEGVARHEDYRRWPAAIAQAQAALAAANPPREGGSPHAPSGPLPSPIIPEQIEIPVGDPRSVLAWIQRDLAGWLDACGARARELGVRDAPILQPTYPLASPICRIVVAGEFSRGKSTLINALFGIQGEINLPTGMTPTTPLACAIRVPNVGESDGATITYRTARPALQLTLDEYRTRVRLVEHRAEVEQAGRSLHLDEARRIEVRVTGAYLPAGVEIEDTPGLNEQEGRSASALAALGRADLILFVLAADQLLGDPEHSLIERLLLEEHHRNVLFLVNFWDTIDDEGQRATLQQRAESLLGSLPSALGGDGGSDSSTPIFYISALQASRAQRQRKPVPEESGILALRGLLRDQLGPGAPSLLIRSRAGRALRYLDLLQISISRAAAASVAGSTPAQDQSGRVLDEACAAAVRTLESLDGAIHGATAATVLRLRSASSLQIAGAADALATRGAGAQDDARRILAAELRWAAGAHAQAMQQAADLIAAQMRAAFLSRGIAAPPLDAAVTAFTPNLGPVESRSALYRALEEQADALEAAGMAMAVRIHAAFLAALPIGDTSSRSTVSSSPRAAAAPRTVALRALEDDVARLKVAVISLRS